MTTTTDLKDFGLRELRMAADLLNAYCDRPPDWLGSGLTLMMNRSSGYVFLTDEDCNVAMMPGFSPPMMGMRASSGILPGSSPPTTSTRTTPIISGIGRRYWRLICPKAGSKRTAATKGLP